jgi:hypothetical protein
MEWVNIRKICFEALSRQGAVDLLPHLESITFGWKYYGQFCSLAYHPTEVFRDFVFDEFTFKSPCPCNTQNRFSKYMDPLTSGSTPDNLIPSLTDTHVRTMDIDIIRHPVLKNNFRSGLNHIPLRRTLLHEVVDTVLDAWNQVCEILHIDPSDQIKWIRDEVWAILKQKASQNTGGFKHSQPSFTKIHPAMDELAWVQQYLFISGLDKASANASFICISHIRAQALLRLQGKDFAPCMLDEGWINPEHKAEELFEDICALLPELPLRIARLPYLMGTFKQHKNAYRWLTNAHNSIYSTIAQFITIALLGIIPLLKQWFSKRIQTYTSLMGVDTSNFWIIDSIIDMALNLPEKIHDIFVADITHCYEAIPLDGDDNLMNAISSLISKAFRQNHIEHPRSIHKLWVKFDEGKSVATTSRWASNTPSNGLWVELTEDRLVEIIQWLVSNCFVTLGDRVWKQIAGIPMGFSCSPLWCNLYFLHYESSFITRLAQLGRVDLMKRFKYSFRYIDDLCILNGGDITHFLDPNSKRVPSNPFWIYPLDIVEIKIEVDRFSTQFPLRGTSAHFMNMQITIFNEKDGLFRTHKFDKRRNLPFQYAQFLQFRSNRSVSQSYNIIQSQTFPILYLSNNVHDVVNELEFLLQVLTTNGFRPHRLKQLLIKFIRLGSFPELKYDILEVLNILERFVLFTLYDEL